MAAATSFPKSEIKIVLAENIHPSADEIFGEEGFKVERLDSALSEDDLRAKALDAHILGIRSKTYLPDWYFKEAKRLLAVGCFCIGTNQVELDDAKKAGVPVFNAPFSNTRSVAELVIAEMVALARQLTDRSRWMHEGRWSKSAKSCYELREKTLGIIGYGHIGSQVGVLAEAFGLRVLYYDIVSKMPIGNAKPMTSLDELLASSDFVSLHVPATAQTENMIGAAEIKKFKKGSFLLNASRGLVVDLAALKSAIDSGAIAGAAIDVFPVEPKNNEDEFKHPLQNTKNVILTPHIGGATEEAQYKIGLETSAALTKFINQGSTSGAVNFPIVDLPKEDSAHRILNVHRNVPGVLSKINQIISELGANIRAQYLSTDPEVGYMVIDMDQDVSLKVKERVSELDTSIRTRFLY